MFRVSVPVCSNTHWPFVSEVIHKQHCELLMGSSIHFCTVQRERETETDRQMLLYFQSLTSLYQASASNLRTSEEVNTAQAASIRRKNEKRGENENVQRERENEKRKIKERMIKENKINKCVYNPHTESGSCQFP
jgi:hypothetical protein